MNTQSTKEVQRKYKDSGKVAVHNARFPVFLSAIKEVRQVATLAWVQVAILWETSTFERLLCFY